jgi:hypothetical protein
MDRMLVSFAPENALRGIATMTDVAAGVGHTEMLVVTTLLPVSAHDIDELVWSVTRNEPAESDEPLYVKAMAVQPLATALFLPLVQKPPSVKKVGALK